MRPRLKPPGRNQSSGELRLGLRANLGQFSLLVLVNAFVGSMLGLERLVVARTMYETLAARGRAPAREPVAAAPSR